MLTIEYTGLIVLFGSLLFMFLLVPVERIKKLLTTGLVAGLGIAILLVLIMEKTGFWTFHGADVLNIFGIPIFLSLAWFPLVIAFIHLCMEYRHFFARVSILLFFPAGATMLHYLLLNKDGLTYKSWNLIYTFLISVLIHLGILVWSIVRGYLKN
jgi:hypothetical protein